MAILISEDEDTGSTQGTDSRRVKGNAAYYETSSSSSSSDDSRISTPSARRGSEESFEKDDNNNNNHNNHGLEKKNFFVKRKDSLNQAADSSNKYRVSLSPRGQFTRLLGAGEGYVPSEESERRRSRQTQPGMGRFCRRSSQRDVAFVGDDRRRWRSVTEILSRRSSLNQDDEEDASDDVDKFLQRRLSGESIDFPGLKALKLAVKEHELPMKLAYEQLDELAANAEKVKSAIERNRSLLTLQVRKANMRYLRTAFTSWLLYWERKRQGKSQLSRVHAQLRHNILARTFRAWHLQNLRTGKIKRLQSSVEKVLARRSLERIWKAWIELVNMRLQEEDERRREKRLIKDIDERRREGLERRGFKVIYKRRLARAFHAFREGIATVKFNQISQQRVVRYLLRKKLSRSFNGWRSVIGLLVFYKNAVKKQTNRRLLRCFMAWKTSNVYEDFCFRKIIKLRVAAVFAAWIHFVDYRKAKTNLLQRIEKRRKQKYFNGFVFSCEEHKRRVCFKNHLIKEVNKRKLKMAFHAWVVFIQLRANKKMLKFQEYVAAVEKENERVRSECERLSRILDAGEWEKQQIADLLQARDVLSGERDALTKLIETLKEQHSKSLENQLKQEERIRCLKDQMLGNNFKLQNKMLVKGASSFNSVVKALKADALKRGIDPSLLYSIDKISMDKVSVFPDGEIHVRAQNTFDKGKWVKRNTAVTPGQKARPANQSPLRRDPAAAAASKQTEKTDSATSITSTHKPLLQSPAPREEASMTANLIEQSSNN